VIARVSGAKGTDVADLVDATPEEIEEARALAARAAPGLFPVLFDRWARAVDEASRLPRPRLLFEMAALDLCAAEPMVPLGDLLQRLDDLEASCAARPAPPSRRRAPARRRRRPAAGQGAVRHSGAGPTPPAAPSEPARRRRAGPRRDRRPSGGVAEAGGA
jgi:DNA polymerase-3 subunit gamma/tau